MASMPDQVCDALLEPMQAPSLQGTTNPVRKPRTTGSQRKGRPFPGAFFKDNGFIARLEKRVKTRRQGIPNDPRIVRDALSRFSEKWAPVFG